MGSIPLDLQLHYLLSHHHILSSNGKPDALSRRPDYIPPPLPSLAILVPTPPVLHTSYLIGAGVLLLPEGVVGG